MKYLLLLALSLSLACLHAEAARRDARQHNQRARIHQGVKSGELTQKEAAGLRAQQRKIRRMERKAEADGVVTGQEKHKIEKAQDRASKSIHNQKHDDQQRGENAPAPQSGENH